ncbi:MAG TPA: septum formation initiator family protein [Elusimicrobiota bacterium]|nr:septum formation initiator family protein [Elusimicrobiota bacterium]
MQERRGLILGIALGVMALLLFGNAGFRSLVQLSLERRALSRTLADLRVEHDRLSQELNRIQADPAYTEFLIRKNLGYVKKGEYEYHLVPGEKQNGG